MTDKKLRR